MCASARKVIGLTPIDPRMLEMQMQSYGAKDMEEAKLMEIKSYLRCEMKMRRFDIDKLEFVKISPPKPIFLNFFLPSYPDHCIDWEWDRR